MQFHAQLHIALLLFFSLSIPATALQLSIEHQQHNQQGTNSGSPPGDPASAISLPSLHPRCEEGIWPFPRTECSGMGICINGSCVCQLGIVGNNDFVISKIIALTEANLFSYYDNSSSPIDSEVLSNGNCLTNYWSRFIFVAALGVLSIFGIISSVVITILSYWPIDTDVPSLGSIHTVLLFAFLEFSAQFVLCLLATLDYWVLTSPALTSAFLVNNVILSFSWPIYSLYLVHCTFCDSGGNPPNFYKKSFWPYFIGSGILTIIIGVSLLAAHLISNYDVKAFSIHILISAFSTRLLFWGLFGLVLCRYIDKVIFSAQDKTIRAEKSRRQIFINSIQCLIGAALGILGAVVVQWYFHIYLVIRIIFLFTKLRWLLNLQQEAVNAGGSTHTAASTTGSSEHQTIP